VTDLSRHRAYRSVHGGSIKYARIRILREYQKNAAGIAPSGFFRNEQNPYAIITCLLPILPDDMVFYMVVKY